MKKERVYEVMKEVGYHKSGVLEDKVRHTMVTVGGLYLNINFKGMFSSQMLNGPDEETNRLLKMVIGDKEMNYDFLFINSQRETTAVQPYDIYESLLKDLSAQYGRDVGLEFIMNYEMGMMVAVPKREMLTKEEREQLFIQSIKHQCGNLNKKLEGVYQKDSRDSIYLEQVYGIQFSNACSEYNLPLFVTTPGNPEYFEEEKQKILSKLETKVEDMVMGGQLEDDYILRKMTIPTLSKNYKMPIGLDKQRFREVQWIFVPATTIIQLGYKSVNKLVKGCLE